MVFVCICRSNKKNTIGKSKKRLYNVASSNSQNTYLLFDLLLNEEFCSIDETWLCFILYCYQHLIKIMDYWIYNIGVKEKSCCESFYGC